MEKLSRHPALDAARQQFEALKRKPYGDLTADEKQQLLSLTQEIRSRCLAGDNQSEHTVMQHAIAAAPAIMSETAPSERLPSGSDFAASGIHKQSAWIQTKWR